MEKNLAKYVNWLKRVIFAPFPLGVLWARKRTLGRFQTSLQCSIQRVFCIRRRFHGTRKLRICLSSWFGLSVSYGTQNAEAHPTLLSSFCLLRFQLGSLRGNRMACNRRFLLSRCIFHRWCICLGSRW